jgi:cell shape-determining protein MreD
MPMPNKIKHVLYSFVHKALYAVGCCLFMAVGNFAFWQGLGVKPLLITIPLYWGTLLNLPFHTVGVVFLFSLIHDGLNGYPMGATPFAALLLFMILASMRVQLNARDFWLNLCAYGLTTLLFQLILYGLLTLDANHTIHFIQTLPSVLLTLALFPLTAKIYHAFIRYLGYTNRV